MQIRCPKCQTVQNTPAQFCKGCGVKFDSEITVAQKKGNNLLVGFLIVGGCLVGISLIGVLTGRHKAENTAQTPLSSISKMSPTPFPLDLTGQVLRVKSEGSGDKQIAENIAKADKSITYEHLKKNAEKYAGQEWVFTGEILEIQESDGVTVARVGLDSYGGKVVWVTGALATNFVEKNKVCVIGYLAGNYSYTSQANWQITIPAVAARAIIKPNEIAKYKAK